MRKITLLMMKDFEKYLYLDEKSEHAIKKYIHDIKSFCSFANSRKIDKALVIEYKNYFVDAYAIISANSMIASVNAFLRFMGRLLFRVKIKLERYLLCANYKKSC